MQTPRLKSASPTRQTLINQVAAPTKAVNQPTSDQVPHATPKRLRDPSRPLKGKKEMKALLVLALSSLCVTAMADEAPTDVAQQKPAIEEYTYSTHLDIAKVISMSEVPDVCGVVPMKMEYDDSNGQRHILRYSIMGNGCSNG
jgi:hypothetical protein